MKENEMPERHMHEVKIVVTVNGKEFAASGKFRTCDETPVPEHIDTAIHRLWDEVSHKAKYGMQ